MGLNAHEMSAVGKLAQLATHSHNTSREEIYLAVASLYRLQGDNLNTRERELVHDILHRLAKYVEPARRVAWTEGFAEDNAKNDESEQKLVDKLAASGLLKAGFLLRVLHQGQCGLFDLALAKLAKLPVAELRVKFYQGGAQAVALACRGAGIDRCVFVTVFTLTRQARNMRTGITEADLAEVERVFSTVPRSQALTELAKLTFN